MSGTGAPAACVDSHSLTHPVCCPGTCCCLELPLAVLRPQPHCEDQCLCDTFVIYSALVKASTHLRFILQNVVRASSLKITQFYAFHTAVHLFALHSFAVFPTRSRRGGATPWMARAGVIQCVFAQLSLRTGHPTSRKSQNPEKLFQ